MSEAAERQVLDASCTPDATAAWAATAPLGTGVLTPFGVLDPELLSHGGRVDLLVALERSAPGSMRSSCACSL